MLTPDFFIIVGATLAVVIPVSLLLREKARAHSGTFGGASDGVRIVTDLDRLVSGPVGFRWKGKIHTIKPMSTATFLGALNEMAKMGELSGDRTRDIKKINRAYYGLFATVCDTITLKDVEAMSQAQVMNLYREINRCVTGEAEGEATEKKTQVAASKPSMPPNSSGNTAAFTAASPPSVL